MDAEVFKTRETDRQIETGIEAYFKKSLKLERKVVEKTFEGEGSGNDLIKIHYTRVQNSYRR